MFIQNLRAKIGARLNGDSEAGFTLIELLVVMLILGILAAIALPAFFNQKSKANDAKAKEKAHTAQVAIETCATENAGSYTSCSVEALEKIEPTLAGTPTLTDETPAEGGYTVKVTAETTNNTYSIVRSKEGVLSYPCTTEKTGGCPSGGSWKNG